VKTIAISGVIGYDVLGKDIRAEIDGAGGEPIEIQVSSPGGLVSEGLEIYNLIKNYKGEKSTRLMGMAASMASYIVLAGDRVIAEDNAIYMVHNPYGVAIGDYKDMRKSAEVLDGFAALLAKAYARKSKKPLAEIREMMDEETFLFGQEIKDAGFVDEVVPAGEGAEDRAQAVSLAMLYMDGCRKTLEQIENTETREKAVALLGIHAQEKKPESPVVDGTTATAATAEKKQEGVMDIKTLEKEHPDVFAEAVAIGAKKERDRVAALDRWSEADAQNQRVLDLVAEAKASGKSEAEIMPALMAAMKAAPQKAGENPPEVTTAAQTTGAGLTDEEKLLVKAMGITEDAYLEQKKKEGK
jgi:ATP-dependent Clp endopeptidase proteolytic subunit ClpP